jgi:predicted MFS family arabinose efflux permease
MLFSVFGTTLFLTMLVVHLTMTLEYSPAEIGWVLSAGGGGAVIGSFVSMKVRKWLSLQATLFAFGSVGGLSIIVFSYSEGIWLVALLNAVGAFCASVQSPCIITMRQQRSPHHLLGRVQATCRFMTWLLMPVAAVLSGILAEWVGTNETICVGGGIATVAAFIYLHRSLK